MDSHKVPGIQSSDDGGLSPIAAAGFPGPSRRAGSVRSIRSETTIVDDGANIGGEGHSSASQFSRTGTLDITINGVSRLDFFYGFFRPKLVTRRIAGKAKVNGVDNFEYESNRGSPFIVSIDAVSRRKDENGHYVPKPARCTLDTGNLQGNFVSRNFLMKDLEYSETDFLQLNPLEKNGGISASNQKLIPEAAVRIDWYHVGSPRLFRNMRFLVMSNTQYDLIIGARTIAKQSLLSPPNFGVEVVQYRAETHDEAVNLTAVKEGLSNDLITLKSELKKIKRDTPNNTTDITNKETEITKKKEHFDEATKVLQEYHKKHPESRGNQPPQTNNVKADGNRPNGKSKKGEPSNNTKDDENTNRQTGGKGFLSGLVHRRNAGGSK